MTIRKTPKEYRLRILAEESAELSQAALKMIRAIEGDTPVSENVFIVVSLSEYLTGVNGITDRMYTTETRERSSSVRGSV